MTEQRRKLLEEFDKWFNSKPNKRIMAAECANITERYAAEQLKLHDVSWRSELLISFCEYLHKRSLLNVVKENIPIRVKLFLETIDKQVE